MLMFIIGLAIIMAGIIAILAITLKWHTEIEQHYNCTPEHTPYTGPIYNRHGRELETASVACKLGAASSARQII